MSREELNRIRDNLFCEFCGKQCKSLNSLNQHSTRCPENPNRKDYNKLGEYSHSNFRGQTKFTNDVIARVSKSIQAGYDSGRVIPYAKGKPSTFKGKHHSEETKQKLSVIGRYNAKNHINGWKAGNSSVPNKYEKYTADFLSNYNIPFQQEFRVLTHKRGGKGVATYYQLDFLIDNKIDLELDGTGHNFDNDYVRDDFIGKEYQIYRIRHNDSIDTLHKELETFINKFDNKEL